MAIIEVNHVTKEFQLGQLHSLKQSVLDAMARFRGQPVPQRALFKALDDVDFKVKPGEVLGIIGHNGAGKSTLLKMLARISTPTHGTVKVHGSVAPLIEVGAGLVPDLTGRENIYLNGVILGMRRAEIRKRFDEIVAFAELEEFIDTPIKRYSSGMQVRLGFSIATSIAADILIVDEVLSVGDLTFQRKCFDRMEDMIKRQGKTVLLVSHNIRQVERLCSRAILLDHGKIVSDGTPAGVCDLFYEWSDKKIKSLSSQTVKNASRSRYYTGEVELLAICILDDSGQPTDRVAYKSNLTFLMKFRLDTDLDLVTFGVGVHTTDFLYLTTHNTEQQLNIQRLARGIHEVRCSVREFPLLPGVYSLRVGVTSGEAVRPVLYAENVLHFQVVTINSAKVAITSRDGFFALDAQWTVSDLDAATGTSHADPSLHPIRT